MIIVIYGSKRESDLLRILNEIYTDDMTSGILFNSLGEEEKVTEYVDGM